MDLLYRFYIEGIVTVSCQMDFNIYPFDSHKCKFRMGSTGFPDSLMTFESTFSYSESTQRPLQYEVKLHLFLRYDLLAKVFLPRKSHFHTFLM